MNTAIDALKRQYPALSPLQQYSGPYAQTPYLADNKLKHERKKVPSIEAVLEACQLRDGMTISFHHAFREGDKIINRVLAIIAAKGVKNLTLASSSLLSCNFPLIEHIKNGVISQIYTSGMRGQLADAISHGLMKNPVQIHSHGGRVHLIQSGEINIDIAFLAVSTSDELGNANGMTGKSKCGSLGYAMVDAQYAQKVVLLTESFVDYPNHPASITQDQVDYIVQVDEVGDASKISVGAARLTSNPRELMIARYAADVIEHSGYFKAGFSLQTGSGASSTACTRFLATRMQAQGIWASFALGGITASIVELHELGLVKRLLDTQSFDEGAALSLANHPEHIEISTNFYANPTSKAAACDELDIVILSALEVDLDFNVNVLTGSDGVMRGASGGHCDTAAAANVTIIVAPLIRSRIPTVIEKVTTIVTPGACVDVLVTDHGIAVNPNRPELKERLIAAHLPVYSIETLYHKAIGLTGVPEPIRFNSRIVGIVRYRDGSVIDVVREVIDE